MEKTFFTNSYKIIFTYRGEVTQSTVISMDDEFIEGFGQVTRHPSDKHNRTLAEKYALTAALKTSTIDRVARTVIWQEFRKYL